MHLFDFLRQMLPANFTTESTEKKQSKGRDGSPSRPKKKTAAKKSSAVASKKKAQPENEMTLDPRSDRTIATLHPSVQPVMRSFVIAAQAIASKQGLDVRAISGLRTYAEQDALYAKGRTAPGARVTNARGGFSNHNFGLAIDIGVFSADGKTYHGTHKLYRELGPLGESLGLEWGGRWKFVDNPHYQFRPEWARGLAEREFLATLRTRVEAKRDILA